MKRAIRAVARLYPKRWRARYGDELEALLEDSRADWRSLGDVFLEAIKMQFIHWGFARIMTVAGLAGALIAAGVSLTLQDRWVCSAVVAVDGNDPATLVSLQKTLLEVESRGALTGVINKLGLYPSERQRMPIEDVLEKMQDALQVTPIAGRSGPITALAVRFEYEDRHKAQQATRELIRKMEDTNGSRGWNMNLDVIDPPSLPARPAGPNRLAFTGSGLLAGLTGGLIIVMAIRTRRKSHGSCPTCGHPIVGPASAGEPVS